MKFRITVIMCVPLSACVAPQQMVWVKPDNTASQEQKDFAECRFEALKATGSAPGGAVTNAYSLSDTIANDLATGMRRNEIMQACLVAKGYSLQPQAQAQAQ